MRNTDLIYRAMSDGCRTVSDLKRYIDGVRLLSFYGAATINR